MGEAQVLEGTTEEITARLRETYPEQTLRVTVEPQEEDLLAGMPLPPNTIRDEAHLVALLLEALNSLKNGATHKVTEDTWEQRKAEVRRRAAQHG